MNAGETYDETLESIGFILEFCCMFCLCLQAFWVVVRSGSLAPAFVLGQWDFYFECVLHVLLSEQVVTENCPL